MNRTFASDNYSGVHPDVMTALHQANESHTPSYGADPYTDRAVNKFREYFGQETEIFFVYNGTGANVTGLSALTHSWQAVICSHLAHINVDESTAPEKFTGCKLIAIPAKDGKINPDEIEACIRRKGDQHHPQAKVISISQSTEYGTVYSREEILAISEVARKHGLYLHMDGSRISNAAVALGQEFASFTKDAGVDVLSFGGTKNGMMFGEAVVFFEKRLAEQFSFIRKQGMQLHSKMRFISAQFERLLTDRLWEKNARHSNEMAKLLEKEMRKHPAIRITQSVDANSIFAIMPPEATKILQQKFFFYVWDEGTHEVRLMCSFDTTSEDVAAFGRLMEKVLTTKKTLRV